MKKQLIIIGSVFCAALLLFLAYELFLKPSSEIETPTDAFYYLSDDVAGAVENLDTSAVITLCGRSESSISADENLNRIRKFAELFATESGGKISVVVAPGSSYDGVTVEVGNSRAEYLFNDFYAFLSDGTRYGFKGEIIIANALLELSGSEKLEIALRPLDGFDADGDTVLAASGKPFLFPSITRADVQSLSITNKNGSYKVYRGTGDNSSSFFFLGAEFVGYDKEKFSQLVVNATYVLSSGKVKDPLELSVYGLDDESKATCVCTVVTTGGKLHKFVIGNLNTAGTAYYARYEGKNHVYLLAAADLQASLLLPMEDYLTALLVNPISETGDLYNVDDVEINFFDTNEKLIADKFARLALSSNASPLKVAASDGTATETDVDEMLTDKKKFSGSYTTWAPGGTLCGFAPTSEGECYTELYLLEYSPSGKYDISFGLIRDESTNAFLPSSIRAAYSTDFGATYNDISASVTPSQSNKEYKTYSISFDSEIPVQYIRLYFTAEKNRYIVMDEISVFGSAGDCQPADALAGVWRLTEPSGYIPEGKNSIYPDSSNFNTFLSSVATLVGDRVVKAGISDNAADSTTLRQSVIAEYGLDNPDFSVSYYFGSYTSTVYFVRPDGDSNEYYAYSILKGKLDGKEISFCTDIIAAITLETAEWLNWDIVDYLDHNLLSMFIDDVETFTITFGGKDYIFNLNKNEAGTLETVTIDGKTVDTQNFRYLYVSVIGMNLKGEYEVGDETPAEILRIKVNGKSKSPEMIFYRVSATKAYYTIDGQGSYYLLVEKVNVIKRNVGLLLAGETVPR